MFNFNFLKKSIVFSGFLFQILFSHAGSYDDFFKAVKLDDLQAVQALLQRGFDPNTLDERGQSALVLALQAPSPKVAEALIRLAQTQIELRNDKDESPLMLAALRGQKSLVELLIWRDADVNKTGWTPLHYAASAGHVEVIKLLLKHSAYIDAESPSKTTPLMMAAMYGNPQSVELLLEEGADASLKNDKGMTALDFADVANKQASARLLVRHMISRPIP